MQSKIMCPECRKVAIVPAGGVKNLDDNFMNRLVDELILKRKVGDETTLECDQCCAEYPAVALCQDCTVFLCEHCLKHHMQSDTSCDHETVSLIEMRYDETIRLKPTPMMCMKHETELLCYYCETCDQLVCMYCAVKYHNSHDVIHHDVKKVIDRHRQEMKDLTAPIEYIIRNLSATHEKKKKKIRQQGNEVKKEIDQHYDRLIQQLMEQKEQLKQQVHKMVSQNENAVTTQLEEVQAEVNKSSDQLPEVLSIKGQMIDRMHKIAHLYNLPPIQPDIDVMKFVPNKDVLPQFGLVCSTDRPDPHNCEVVDPPNRSIKGKKTEFTIITKDKKGNNCFGDSQVSVQLGGVIGTSQVRNNDDGSYVASFVPQQVGELKLSVFINGQHIKESPYSVMVIKNYTSVNKPSKIVNNGGTMGRPWGIAFGKSGMWAVADWSKHLVYIFDGDDRLVRKLGSFGIGNDQFHCPAGVSLPCRSCI